MNGNSAKLKLLLYADFRSPHAQAWANGIEMSGIEVVRLSSHAIEHESSSTDMGSISQSLRGKLAMKTRSTTPIVGRLLRWGSSFQWVHSAYYILFTRRHEVRALRAAIRRHEPNLIHSLRIPYESVTVSAVNTEVPWIASSWGSDFEPQARTDNVLKWWTRGVLKRVDGFTYDSPPDYERAKLFGLPSTTPHLFVAGNLGVDTSLFWNDDKKLDLVLYPRKISSASNYWGFVEAAARLMNDTVFRFVAVGLEPIRSDIIRRFPILNNDRFVTTDPLAQEAYAELVRTARVIVSPNYVDGTPNTVLEGLVSGAFVVAGRLPQLEPLADQHDSSMTLIDPSNVDEITYAIEIGMEREAPSDVELPSPYDRKFAIQLVSEFYKRILETSSKVK